MRAPQEPLAWPAAHAELPDTKRNEVEIAADFRFNRCVVAILYHSLTAPPAWSKSTLTIEDWTAE